MRAMILAAALGVASMMGTSVAEASVEARPHRARVVRRPHHRPVRTVRSYHTYRGRTFYWKVIRVPYYRKVLLLDDYGNVTEVVRKLYRTKRVRVFRHRHY